MVAPQLYAPYHQHFFKMRPDLAIDGVKNTAYVVDIEADPEDAQRNPFCNAFQMKKVRLDTEKQARGNLRFESSRSWK